MPKDEKKVPKTKEVRALLQVGLGSPDVKSFTIIAKGEIVELPTRVADRLIKGGQVEAIN